jgi:hypothetical protein
MQADLVAEIGDGHPVHQVAPQKQDFFLGTERATGALGHRVRPWTALAHGAWSVTFLPDQHTA